MKSGHQYPYDPNRFPIVCGECGFWLLLDRTCPNEKCPSNVPTVIVPVTTMEDAVRRLYASEQQEGRRGEGE